MAYGERLWHVRKDSRSREARLVSLPDRHGDFQLQLYFDGALVDTRHCSTREEAVQDATAQLQALQIEDGLRKRTGSPGAQRRVLSLGHAGRRS